MNKAKSITPKEAEQIISTLASQDKDIFWIGIETGLRIGDILQLRVNDLQHNPMEIYEQKTKRRRTIKISEELSRHLRNRYQRFTYTNYPFLKMIDNSSNLLFKSRRGTGKPINRSTYYRHLKNASTALKIDCSAHSTRKLYAQNIFKSTNSIIQVQKALGHKYMTTTATYLDIDVEHLLQEYGK